MFFMEIKNSKCSAILSNKISLKAKKEILTSN